jgi:hypothetical protein
MNPISVSNENITSASSASAQAPTAAGALLFPAVSKSSDCTAAKPGAIKRLLRHRVTGLYYNNGDWTMNSIQATVFTDFLQAARVCARYGLTAVDLTLRMDDASDFYSKPLN